MIGFQNNFAGNFTYRADSVAWDWHKMLGAPIQTAVFVTKHKNLLRQSHGACASYLFQAQKHYDTSYDSGKMVAHTKN